MKKAWTWLMSGILVFGAGAVLAGGSGPGSGDAPAGHEEATTGEGAGKAVVVKRQAQCPVMGGAINRKLFVDHEGKRVYVCCEGCLSPVKKDPAKYIEKLESEGITLDKTPAGAATNTPPANPRTGHEEHGAHNHGSSRH